MSKMPLGKDVKQPRGHDPSVLYPITRRPCPIPVYGYDLWRSYELSWLNKKGKPEVGILELAYPRESECIVESKSLKLYLNGLSQAAFDSAAEVKNTIQQDLERILVSPWIFVRIIDQKRFFELSCEPQMPGVCLDLLDVSIDIYQRDPALLSCHKGLQEETLSSDLLRTSCPITGQPDWASVVICYRGRRIDHSSLLKYLCSYRDYAGFAEEVCEQIFLDIFEKCSPETLSVRCFYTRRGGIDITPHRLSEPIGSEDIERTRLIRQ
jgi:7-cyano-7-deazaguanine reductase